MPVACSPGDDGALRGGARCRAGGRAERITDEHSRTNRSLVMTAREVRGEIQSPLSPHAKSTTPPQGAGYEVRTSVNRSRQAAGNSTRRD